MKRILLAAMLTSGHAFAAEWLPLPDAGSADQYFYDNSKLVIKDDEITYWKKILFKTPQPVKGRNATSRIVRERIDCGEHSAKSLSYLYYSAEGETLDHVAQDDSAAVPIIPDTVADAFDRVLCPLVWRKQEEMRIEAEQAAAEAELKQAPKKKEDAVGPTIPAPIKPASPQAPDVRLPEKQPEAPLPMPQIMEQLY
jgi:hypothetical protein